MPTPRSEASASPAMGTVRDRGIPLLSAQTIVMPATSASARRSWMGAMLEVIQSPRLSTVLSKTPSRSDFPDDGRMLTAMSGVRRVVPVTLGLIDLPERILVQDGSDRELRVPVPRALVQSDGGWLLLDTGFNTALITDPGLHRRFHGNPVMRPVIPGPGEPLDDALDGAGIDIADIHAVAVSPLHWDHAGGL